MLQRATPMALAFVNALNNRKPLPVNKVETMVAGAVHADVGLIRERGASINFGMPAAPASFHLGHYERAFSTCYPQRKVKAFHTKRGVRVIVDHEPGERVFTMDELFHAANDFMRGRRHA